MKTYPEWDAQESVRGERDTASFIGGIPQKGREKGAGGKDGYSESPNDQGDLTTNLSIAGMWADRYPNIFVDANYERSRIETRAVLTVSFLVLVSVAGMWIYWNAHPVKTDIDFIYNIGLAGGILLLLAFTYTLRKRLRVMRNVGPLVAWYYFHLLGGIVGPLLIIFHTGFTLRSVNSSVALATMLSVALSGVFGRYIYTRIGYQLHRRLLTMRETEARLSEDMARYKRFSTGSMEQNLKKLTEAILSTNSTWISIPLQFLTMRAKAASCYMQSSVDLASMIKRRAHIEGWNDEALEAEIAREKNRLREHINALVAIGQFHFYERLLVGWRIFHIPMLFILLISGLVHVLAVHMY